MIESIGYVLALLMGVVLGALGGGGSIMTVPILVYCFNISALEATAYSLVVVGVTSGVAAIRYWQSGLLNFRIAALFSIPSVIGVLCARLYVLPLVPEHMNWFGKYMSRDDLILVVFAMLIIVIAGFMFKSKDTDQKQKSSPEKETYLPKTSLIIGLEGFVVGVVTGFVGAGGGFMIVPALTLLAGLPLKSAIATSLLIISAKSLIGSLADISNGWPIDWVFLKYVLALTLIGTFLGTALNKRLPAKKLRVGFAWFVLIMGAFILIREMGIG